MAVSLPYAIGRNLNINAIIRTIKVLINCDNINMVIVLWLIAFIYVTELIDISAIVVSRLMVQLQVHSIR